MSSLRGCGVRYMYLGSFLLLPQVRQSSLSECWSQGSAQEATVTRGSCAKAECSLLSLTTAKGLTQLVQYLGTSILVRAQSSKSCGAHYRCRMQNPTLDMLNQHLYHASHHVLPCPRVPEILLCDESIFYLSLNFC